MNTSIVIATSLRRDHLERCLRAVAAHRTRHAVEVLTVHAPGDDESVAMVRSQFPGVRVILSDERNISHQRNLGAAAAVGELLFFIDDDAWPDADCLDELVATMDSDPRIGAVGGPALEPDGALQHGPVATNEFGLRRPVSGPDALPAGWMFSMTGCNMAVRATALRAAGGFDENYAFHLDDTDASVRIFRAGRRVVWNERARVFHARAVGPRRRTFWDKDWRSVAMNQTYFAFRHVAHGRWRIAVLPVVHQAARARFLASGLLLGHLAPAAFLRCETRLLRGIVAGYWKGLVRRPKLPFAPTAARPSRAHGAELTDGARLRPAARLAPRPSAP